MMIYFRCNLNHEAILHTKIKKKNLSLISHFITLKKITHSIFAKFTLHELCK